MSWPLSPSKLFTSIGRLCNRCLSCSRISVPAFIIRWLQSSPVVCARSSLALSRPNRIPNLKNLRRDLWLSRRIVLAYLAVSAVACFQVGLPDGLNSFSHDHPRKSWPCFGRGSRAGVPPWARLRSHRRHHRHQQRAIPAARCDALWASLCRRARGHRRGPRLGGGGVPRGAASSQRSLGGTAGRDYIARPRTLRAGDFF